MIVLFVGPQGCGKGTQADIISVKLGLPHISMGDLLRAVQGELKKEVEAILNSGKLVPVDLTIRIIKERISQADCKKGCILDGFPRTLEQARELDKIAKVNKVVEIFISDREAVDRIANRWSCKKCGAVYNVVSSPPRKEGHCDKDREKLYQRADDNEEALRKRLDIYHKETEPILKHYPSFKINGEQSIENVTRDILKVLK